jgi:helicase MOV-10
MSSFEMERPVSVCRQSSALKEILKPTGPYRKQGRSIPRKLSGKKFFGTKPSSSSQRFSKDLEEFTIPGNYNTPEGVEPEETYLAESFLKLNTTLLNSEILIESLPLFSQHYWSMLFFEEIGLQNELDNYASENVSFRKTEKFYWLEVPGLAEKRPSVLRGDEVEATQVLSTGESMKFRGFVWNVEQTRIQISFHTKLDAIFRSDSRFNVRYLFKRTNMRIMHDTLKRINSAVVGTAQDRVSSILFPTPDVVNEEELRPPPPVITLPQHFLLNSTQKLALEMIINSSNSDVTSHPSPFVLFGPPGTGKTHTLVHTVIELMSMRPASKLLLLAPSNQAADLLVEKLSPHFNPSIMFRLMSFQRNRSDVSATVLRHCGEEFIFPPISDLQQFSILVSTCSMSSKLFYYGFPSNYFDTIFIDESGHCWEPEALAAFMNFFSDTSSENEVTTRTKLVLAGDPQQLGPVVRSTQAKAYGLSLSLLERLTKHSLVYAHDITAFPNTSGYNPKYIVQLIDCYRCHPAIIELPNQLFYNNSLRSAASPSITNTFLGQEVLINPVMPVIFHGCVGENEQESNSPSWFNAIECEIVLSYVQQLSQLRHLGFQLKDIGIVTPYHKQVQKIRKALNTIPEFSSSNSENNKITIGSCEQFQGQERKVIIISTVRSSAELFEQDEYFDIGFVGNSKRFNVAITRAQALLIVIGNPKALHKDAHWGLLLKHCVDNGCYTGHDIRPPSEI